MLRDVRFQSFKVPKSQSSSTGIPHETLKPSIAALISSEVFHERIGEVRAVIVGDARGLTFDFLHQSIKIITRIGNTDHPDRRAIPESGRIEFRDGNVKTGAQPVFHAAHDLPPIF